MAAIGSYAATQVPSREERTAEADPVADHYDADYPSIDTTEPCNIDDAAIRAGVVHDVPWYVAMASRAGERVLDFGAGTGRIAIPLARCGAQVTAVEPSAAMRRILRTKLRGLPRALARRIELRGEIGTGYDAAILAFGVVATLPSLAEQRAALERICASLRPGGVVALDVPHIHRLVPDLGLRFAWARVHPETRVRYVRRAAVAPITDLQRTSLHGEYDGDSLQSFRIDLRLLHRFELALLLELAGFSAPALAGDVDGSPVGTTDRIYAVARKRSRRGRGQTDGKTWLPPDESLPPVARTGLAAAAARANELRRSQPLVVDPVAVRLQGRVGPRLLAELEGEIVAGPTVVRARWFDDRMREAFAAGIRRVVTIGAGMDTRPFRLTSQRCVWTELDLPEVISFKSEWCADLQPDIVRLGADLRTPSGLSVVRSTISKEPTVFVLEGVLSYLGGTASRAIVAAILEDAAPGSMILADINRTHAVDGSPREQIALTLASAGAALELDALEGRVLFEHARWRVDSTHCGGPNATFGRVAPATAESSGVHLFCVRRQRTAVP